MSFTYEREIPASPEILFAIFEDEQLWPKWVPGIAKVKRTSPRPFGLDTTRTGTFAGGVKVSERFIVWSPARKWPFASPVPPQRIWSFFGEHYKVENLGGDRCKLTWNVAYEPRFIFAKLHFLFGPVMKKGLGLIMDSLVRYVQNTAPDYALKLASAA